MRHGFTRTELAAVMVATTVLGAVGVTIAGAEPSGRTERLMESLANLRAIGSANAAYRADNAGFLPLELTTNTRRYRPNRPPGGFCSWSWGGKNCNRWWFASAPFDIEAADRPINAYLYPGYTFTAPTAPARLPADDPARVNQQAHVFRDPADLNGRQRFWGSFNTPPISNYDDLGTSYHAQMDWFNQISRGFPNLDFVAKYNLGTARLASDQGVDPARFIHYFDEVGSLVIDNPYPAAHIQGNHGVENAGVTLFADGHAGLVTFTAGANRGSAITPTYSVWFEDLGRPAGRTLTVGAPR